MAQILPYALRCLALTRDHGERLELIAPYISPTYDELLTKIRELPSEPTGEMFLPYFPEAYHAEWVALWQEGADTLLFERHLEDLVRSYTSHQLTLRLKATQEASGIEAVLANLAPFTLSQRLNPLKRTGLLDSLDAVLVDTHTIDIGRFAEEVLHITPVEVGNLLVLGARPGVGKTAVALRVALDLIRQQRHVHFVSYEMSDRQIVTRIVSMILQIPVQDVTQEILTMPACRVALNAIDPYLHIYHTRQGIDLILAQIAETLAPGELLIIDHLHLIPVAGKTSRSEELGEITRKLKTVALSREIVVLLLAQLGRGVTNASEPTLNDLRWSANIEADADLVALLHETDEATICRIAKNRQGYQNVSALPFHWPYAPLETLLTSEWVLGE